MKLETLDGRWFSLKVNGYEFPDEELGPTADNPSDEFETGRFLLIAVSFGTPAEAWNASGPILTTVELGRFADWLDSVRNGRPSSKGVYFTERELEFTVDYKAGTLSVHACRDFLPPWKEASESVNIDFPLSQIDLASAVQSLHTQLKDYPGRPPIDYAN